MPPRRTSVPALAPCSGDWARAVLADAGSTWRADFTPAKYYEHLRKEIEREDGITNQRLTWAMTAQGFLIAALTVLIVSPWSLDRLGSGAADNALLRVLVFRELALLVVPTVGLLAAWVTWRGVSASRRAIERVKADWRVVNDVLRIVPEMAPHAFGDGPLFLYGSRFALFLPVVFAVLWLAYLAAYALVLAPLVLAHLRAL